MAMPPHKIYLHTYNVTTFAGTHEVANEALVLKLHTCVSHGVAVWQPARGGKPRLGGRPAFLAAPLPRMGWQRPACGCHIPAPFATLARRKDQRAHTVDDAGRLSDAFEITVPLAFLYDPAMMPLRPARNLRTSAPTDCRSCRKRSGKRTRPHTARIAPSWTGRASTTSASACGAAAEGGAPAMVRTHTWGRMN